MEDGINSIIDTIEHAKAALKCLSDIQKYIDEGSLNNISATIENYKKLGEINGWNVAGQQS